MDFGDILNQWESQQKEQKQKIKYNQTSHKKANAPGPEDKDEMQLQNERRANPMDVWLNRYGVVDKDKIAESAEERSKFYNVEYLKSLRPQATIDLHQLTRDEAWSRLNGFVNDCVRRGLKKILIIHGKGVHSHGSDPVLGPMVKTFIEQDKRLGMSGHPDRNNGGSGATWVIIKQ